MADFTLTHQSGIETVSPTKSKIFACYPTTKYSVLAPGLDRELCMVRAASVFIAPGSPPPAQEPDTLEVHNSDEYLSS